MPNKLKQSSFRVTARNCGGIVEPGRYPYRVSNSFKLGMDGYQDVPEKEWFHFILLACHKIKNSFSSN